MSVETVHAGGAYDDVREALQSVPQEVWRGAGADALLQRVGMALLGHIKRAYVTRARGGTDEAGYRWAPLKPATIAYGRGGYSRAERGRNARPSRGLDARQQERWWALYRQGLAIYDGDKGAAAKRAWGILKGEGATTLFDKYSGRIVEILRSTGRLYNSIQVLETGPGSVTIGSNVAYAAAHHNGVPGKLPQRRLWPEPSSWPRAWWEDVLAVLVQGVVDQITEQARNP